MALVHPDTQNGTGIPFTFGTISVRVTNQQEALDKRIERIASAYGISKKKGKSRKVVDAIKRRFPK